MARLNDKDWEEWAQYYYISQDDPGRDLEGELLSATDRMDARARGVSEEEIARMKQESDRHWNRVQVENLVRMKRAHYTGNPPYSDPSKLG